MAKEERVSKREALLLWSKVARDEKADYKLRLRAIEKISKYSKWNRKRRRTVQPPTQDEVINELIRQMERDRYKGGKTQ